MPIVDSTVRLANLRSGGLDLIERVLATDIKTVRDDSKLKLSKAVSLGWNGILINVANGTKADNPLGKDARVRRAFELSIDREALNQVVFNGEFVPGNQWVSPQNFYYQQAFPIPKRDVAKAKALLKEAGVSAPLTLDFMVPNGPENRAVAEIIQSMAAEAGFTINIQATEFASSLQLATNGEFEAYLIGWSGRTDPDGNIYNFVACKAPPAINAGHYCNADVDRELDAARTAAEPAERLAHYAKVAERTLADRPLIYLWHNKWLYAMSKKLAGFTPYPDGLIRPQGLRME
jgi:peptide/nickel transport system substrate-binding protein